MRAVCPPVKGSRLGVNPLTQRRKLSAYRINPAIGLRPISSNGVLIRAEVDKRSLHLPESQMRMHLGNLVRGQTMRLKLTSNLRNLDTRSTNDRTKHGRVDLAFDSHDKSLAPSQQKQASWLHDDTQNFGECAHDFGSLAPIDAQPQQPRSAEAGKLLHCCTRRPAPSGEAPGSRPRSPSSSE